MVTKIWAIKDSLQRVLDYAANPDKTEYDALAQTLHYTGFRIPKLLFIKGNNQLAEEGFFRCNYCYLVNLRHVDFLDGNTVMVGGHPLQISRNRRKDFLQQMTGFYGKGGR